MRYIEMPRPNAAPEPKAVDMISSKISLAALIAGALTLSACTEPGQLGAGPNDPNQKTKNGALIGAASGAVLGALTADDGNRGDRALAGALLGGAAGAGIGYSLDRQEAELRRQMDSRVVITNTGDRLIVTLPQDITFATDSTNVKSSFDPVLDAVSEVLNEYKSTMIQVAGHTDSTGGDRYNLLLSQQRAQAVSNKLSGYGVEQVRLDTVGFGETQPIASNNTASGREQNRRVELTLLPYTK